MTDAEVMFTHIIRSGIVSSIVDESKRLARVKFPDIDFISGPLQVLEFPWMKITTTVNDGHLHTATTPTEIKQWMPKVNEKVLCLFLPVDDGDGFILGVIP